ncbi:MAG: DNA repair protein RecN [Deltaproteobacteria bacterium]|nr:DNA repair protein RecN [Deltaproteobacteria bacterium]
MLIHLSIRDLAIIDRLEVSFGPGLNILSGETGAGKSIILGAVYLLMGVRAPSDLIRDGASEAVVSGLFDLSDQSEKSGLWAEYGIDPGEDLLLKRVVSATGRSRAYINDRLVNLGLLAEVGSRLLSISGQHEAQRLLREEEQLLLLDRFGGLDGDRDEVGQAQARLTKLEAEMDRLKRLAGDREREVELLTFQLAEIAKAAPEPGEEKELEAERRRLGHAERLERGVREIHEALYEAEGSVVEVLSRSQAELGRLADLDQSLSPLAARLEESAYALEDAARELEDYARQVVFDPQRQTEVGERLDLLKGLIRKHGQGEGVTGVLARAEAMTEELNSLNNLDLESSRLEEEACDLGRKLNRLAEKLSQGRAEAGGKLAKAVAGELETLGLEGASFQVSIETQPGPVGPSGRDRVVFLLTTNPGESLKPLSRVASGGEMSRVTLALKSILAGRGAVDTVVFDEVDAGIGGRIAEVVGRKLGEVGGRHQVLCITHLPQIAAFGRSHLRVVKTSSGARTVARIESLDEEERVRELARMLAGERLTEKAIEHAREMLASAS